MIIDMYNLGKAFVDSGGGSGGSGLTKQQQRLSLLTENHQVGTPLFMLYLDESGTARLEMQEVQEGHSYRLPFIKVAPNAAYLTPVFKADVKKGLKASKRNTTLNSFRQLAAAKRPSAPYFRRIVETLTATKLRIAGEPAAVTVSDAFTATVDQIVAAKLSGRSPLIGIASDDKGDVWPGDDERFVEWILNARQRISIYETKAVPNGKHGICPLSGEEGELFSNGLAGAGLNFVNGDFEGSFSELNNDRAWQRSAISSTAADMLYIYKNHVASEFFEYIGGSKALVIPAASADDRSRQSFVKGVRQLVDSHAKDRKENRLLRKLAQNEASVASISLLWADFGQKFEEARGLITHVLPSRLAELQRIHTEYEESPHPFHPQHGDFENVRRPLDLNFSLIADLVYRPGGARVKDENASPRRHNALRETVAAIYHRQPMEPDGLWKQIAQTARAYVVLLLEQSESKGVVYQLRFEGPNQPKKQMPLTVNGWIRHLTMLLSYLADPRIGVFSQEEHVYEPTQESLRPLLSEAKGLDNEAKCFAFLLGVLYGHLIYVQAEKAKVSVASNALSWMRSGRVRAADLPELYSKIASKLLEYHALDVARKFRRIHEIEAELAHLGTVVGTDINARDLPDDKVLYFLMLGMAMSYTFTRSDSPDAKKTGDHQ